MPPVKNLHVTSYGGIIRIRLKGRSLITSSQPANTSSPVFISEDIIYAVTEKHKLFLCGLYFRFRNLSQQDARRQNVLVLIIGSGNQRSCSGGTGGDAQTTAKALGFLHITVSAFLISYSYYSILGSEININGGKSL